ncbi:MAG: formyltetrahydrofolate deformylase [Candidatus Competibacterales bacterium]
MPQFIINLSCPDTVGIVASVAGFLAERQCNVLTSAQHHDPQTGLFFMRVKFDAPDTQALEPLTEEFQTIGQRFAMQWRCYDTREKARVLIMVSRFGHCLNDLLYRYRIGALPMVVAAIVSNHRDFYQLAASHDIPFHHLPVTSHNKERQERRLLELMDDEAVELVVLARYMQVLSDGLCSQLEGRAINIHHSFLPSFKGAKPYHQAHARGVKLVGATAHFVTPDLDEGPIIEQDVVKVDHGMTVEDFVAVGRDTESLVLARAVQSYLERRVLINGDKTVVFR